MFGTEPKTVFEICEEYLTFVQEEACDYEDLSSHFTAILHLLLPRWKDLALDLTGGWCSGSSSDSQRRGSVVSILLFIFLAPNNLATSPSNLRVLLGHLRHRFEQHPWRTDLPAEVVAPQMCQPPHFYRLPAADADGSARRHRYSGDADQVRAGSPKEKEVLHLSSSVHSSLSMSAAIPARSAAEIH